MGGAEVDVPKYSRQVVRSISRNSCDNRVCHNWKAARPANYHDLATYF